MGLGHRQTVLLSCQVTHLGIRLPVMQGHCGQIVEGLVQVVRYMGYRERAERETYSNEKVDKNGCQHTKKVYKL